MRYLLWQVPGGYVKVIFSSDYRWNHIIATAVVAA